MQLRRNVVPVLLLLSTCCERDQGNRSRVESSRAALGVVPATEKATWTRLGPPAVPDSRYLQSAAFDETRNVLVMFGGLVWASLGGQRDDRELWEWNPATSTWTNRTPAGSNPSVRKAASMVFDSAHNKFEIFGGRVVVPGAGTDVSPVYADSAELWEWDPGSGAMSDRSGKGPVARSQHSMVFEKSTGKVLLFGGARNLSIDAEVNLGDDVSVGLGDTWEWDPAAGKWTQIQPKVAPSARYGGALVWDSTRSRAVLFGGMEKSQVGLPGIPKQDTWEWDPTAQTWTDRTIAGDKPTPRFGHAMAYDPASGMVVLVGGWDIDSTFGLADVWQWDPNTGAWSERLTGSEPNLPTARLYASLVTDTAQGRLDLVGGLSWPEVSRDGEIWELDPVAAIFTDRTPTLGKWPSPRASYAMAFCPATGKTYMFGGTADDPDANIFFDDLWEWDGTSWSQVQTDVRPPGRSGAAMAYDPLRKSLILFGGVNNSPVGIMEQLVLGDTWEWNSSTRKWSQLQPTASPEPRQDHAMVTDSGRAKVLLFGGYLLTRAATYPTPGTQRKPDPLNNAVWEWDGGKLTWTNRTPVSFTLTPPGYASFESLLAFDDARQKVLLVDTGTSSSDNVAFWEWDPVSAGWAKRDSGDIVHFDGDAFVVYDSLRRRAVVPVVADTPNSFSPSVVWEISTKGPTWYLRNLPASTNQFPMWPTAQFDSQRRVVVVFGGTIDGIMSTSETWEYEVTNLGNGEGCTSATASTCASGFCVDGVCCGTASCSGACQSCAADGQEGTCAPVAGGTEVPGSCAGGQACDSSGACKSKNGTTCSAATVCASGFCVDGVCCENKCNGICVSCNQAGLAGKCSAYAAGSDPESECGTGSDPCRLTCNGAGTCDAPPVGTSCGFCATCDSTGKCVTPDPSPCGAGGTGADGASGSGGTAGTTTGGRGGSGGAGGVGGTIIGGAGGSGGTAGVGGTGIGGAGGSVGTGGVNSSPDGGRDAMVPDTGGAAGGTDAMAYDAITNGGRDAIAPDAGSTPRLGRSGCSCDLGQTSRGTSKLPFVLLGVAFLWTMRMRTTARRTTPGRRRSASVRDSGGGSDQREAASVGDRCEPCAPPRPHSHALSTSREPHTNSPGGLRDGQPTLPTPRASRSPVALTPTLSRLATRDPRPAGRPGWPTVSLQVPAALLLLATCSASNPADRPRIESSHAALGTVPPSEVATWTRVSAPVPLSPGARYLQSAAFDETRNVLVMFGGWGGNYATALQELWEWDPAAGAWTQRTLVGSKLVARCGASMVFDSTRNKFVIFGGRANSGYDLADTWEWDPGTGAFTNRTASVGPSARSQHSMVFEKSTGKVLLFGGGLAGSTSDQTSISLAFGDTWEWDAGAGTWNQLNPTSAPGARYDSALIWDSKRNRAVLFGGMQKPQADVDGIPQNDVWEWDPAKASWTLRPSKGTQPTARWGHAMAYDPGRGMAVLAGGKDLDTNLELADLWDWDPNSATWTQRLDGSEPNLPAARMYASLVTAQNRLDLLAGLTLDEESGKEVASRELWALDPASATFTNRSVIQSGPSPRGDHSIAFCPATGKTYIFGGGRLDTSAPLNDLWEWDGSSWSEVQADVRPPARGGAAIAYDPYRKSLVIFAGCSTPMSFSDATECFYDTWEWQSSTRKWTQLFPATSPDYSNWNGNSPPQMVTDSGRGKLLLFGVAASNNSTAVWEWDGATTTWTNRTPTPGSVIPKFYDPKTNSSDASTSVTFDDARQKMFVFAGQSQWQGTTSNSVFWEWDPVSAGWAFRDSGDIINLSYSLGVAYDSLRRRQVLLAADQSPTGSTMALDTWELDPKGPTWYLRTFPGDSAGGGYWPMAFDSKRGVMVLFCTPADGSSDVTETWEYKVTNLGNGEGCTAATASTCASGFCVDGVCCASAACSGTCQSCSVAGYEGTCTVAAGGTEVPGSCPGQACDSSGSCNAKNGTACSSASTCASGFCVDGVCCESVCDGTCVSCNQAGRAGKCSAYVAGSDPENECTFGLGACRATCNGAGACDYPRAGTPCGNSCQACDGNGMCVNDPSCAPSGTGGRSGTGGSGGTGAGGASGRGGASGVGGTAAGGATGFGGAMTGGVGGTVSGGAGGRGGASGVGGSAGGGTTSVGGAGGIVAGGAGGTSDSPSSGAGGAGGTGGASGSPDGGGGFLPSDAGRVDGGQDSRPLDSGSTMGLGHKGCNCDLGQTASGEPGLPFALLGAAFLWRRLRRRRGRSVETAGTAQRRLVLPARRS